MVRNDGTSFISVRVIITIAMLMVIAGLFYVGIKQALPIIEENNIKRQVLSLDTLLHEMAGGDARNVLTENHRVKSGEKRIFRINLPSSISYFSIGTDADPNNDGKLQSKLMYDGRVIVYKIKGRSKKIYWLDSNIKLRLGEYKNGDWTIKEPEEGLVIQNGGKYKITLELVKYHNENIILIYGNNSVPYIS